MEKSEYLHVLTVLMHEFSFEEEYEDLVSDMESFLAEYKEKNNKK